MSKYAIEIMSPKTEKTTCRPFCEIPAIKLRIPRQTRQILLEQLIAAESQDLENVSLTVFVAKKQISFYGPRGGSLNV